MARQRLISSLVRQPILTLRVNLGTAAYAFGGRSAVDNAHQGIISNQQALARVDEVIARLPSEPVIDLRDQPVSGTDRMFLP